MNPLEVVAIEPLQAYIWPSFWIALGVATCLLAYLLIKQRKELKAVEAERQRRKKN